MTDIDTHNGTSRAPFSTQIPRDLAERVRAAVRGVSQGTGTDYTLAQLTEDALHAQVARLEELYHEGQPWPPAPQPLRRGRRTT
jgi:hypothetical protein